MFFPFLQQRNKNNKKNILSLLYIIIFYYNCNVTININNKNIKNKANLKLNQVDYS